MTTAEILALPLDDNDAGAATIGEYLCALLEAVWTEEEGFSGKRPFGNSDWKGDVYFALVSAGIVDGKISEEDDFSYLEEVDRKQANKIILDCIQEVFTHSDE